MLFRRLMHWAGAVVLAMAVSSCLVRQEDDVLPELPPLKNRRPVIISHLEPQQTFTVDSARCGLQRFAATIEDPDVGDRIHIRWFIDPKFGDQDPEELPQTPSVEVGRSPLIVERNLLIGGAGKLSTGKHMIELFIADGFPEGRTPLPRNVTMPDGTTRENATYFDSFLWFVDVPAGACP
ncbi:MAG: hypothetical protein ACOZIN_20250 [Myxococcota bacterium]